MYTQYYGLRAQPFRLTPDPTFFYSSATHKSALAYMRYGMQQGEGFIVVTGAPGSGKTTLALTLINGLPRHKMVIGELVTTQLQPEDLLRAIAAAFELEVEGSKSDLIVRLQDFFSARTRAGKHVLLVVDEAHDLPQASFEELRMLSNLHRGPQALLQCILLGQPPLRDLLTQANMDQFQQRVIAAHHLHPLSLIETRGYILHRLQQSGWRGDPSFDAETIKLVHQFTQGIPRRINALCTRLMLYGFIEEKRHIDATATTQVYNEWVQELGQSAFVEPIRQSHLEEFNFAGLTKEHAVRGHAVGDDVLPFRAAPITRRHEKTTTSTMTAKARTAEAAPKNVHHKTTMSSPPPGGPPNIPNSPAHAVTAQSSLTELISRRSYPLIQEDSPRSTQQSHRHPKAYWLFSALAALAVVIAMVLYIPAKDFSGRMNANKSASHAQNQTTVTPKTLEANTPVATQSLPPTENTHPPAQTTSAKEARPVTDKKTISPAISTTVVKLANPENTTSAVHSHQAGLAESEFAAIVPQPEGMAQPDPPAADTVSTQASHATTSEPDIAAVKSPSDTVLQPEPVEHADLAKQAKNVAAAETNFSTEAPPPVAKSRPEIASRASTHKRAQQNSKGHQLTRSVPRSTVKASVASVSVAYANPNHESTPENKHVASTPGQSIQAPKALSISEGELSALLARFRDAYNSGNLNELSQLFASNARSDEDDSRDAIVRSYQRLFNLTDDRDLALSDLHWQSAGDAVNGAGRFDVKLKEKGRNWQSAFSGTITIRIEKHDDQMLITVLNYSYAQ